MTAPGEIYRIESIQRSGDGRDRREVGHEALWDGDDGVAVGGQRQPLFLILVIETQVRSEIDHQVAQELPMTVVQPLNLKRSRDSFCNSHNFLLVGIPRRPLPRTLWRQTFRVCGELRTQHPGQRRPGRELGAVPARPHTIAIVEDLLRVLVFAMIWLVPPIICLMKGKIGLGLFSLLAPIGASLLAFGLAAGFWFVNDDIGDTDLDSLGALLIALLIGFALWAIIVAGAFVAAVFGAIRLAKPDSSWARRYDDAKLAASRGRFDKPVVPLPISPTTVTRP